MSGIYFCKKFLENFKKLWRAFKRSSISTTLLVTKICSHEQNNLNCLNSDRSVRWNFSEDSAKILENLGRNLENVGNILAKVLGKWPGT